MNFPEERDARITLQGPAGELEVLTSVQREHSANAVVIVCHPHPLYQGTMSNKVVFSIARAFESLGLKTIRFNYRGVGASEGEYSEAIGEADDTLAILKWAQEVLPDHEIWLAGFSFGGYVAARAASLFSGAPFMGKQVFERSSFKDGMTLGIKQLLTVAPSVEHFDIDALGEINVPWLVIQGESDEVVPADAVEKWAKQSKEKPELVLLPEVGHFFHGHLPELKSIIIKHYEDKVTR